MRFYDQIANMRLKEVFVQNLRKTRKFRGISQMSLAEQCGTSTSYIGQIEIGNRFPSLELIEKMAKVLGIRPHLLFLDEYETEDIPITTSQPKMSDDEKEKLVSRLTSAIQKIVKQI